MKYEMMIGLETHVELATKTKLFCSCSTAFGGKPNTRCCSICTGEPGTLPSINREAVRLAVRAGLALGCTINKTTRMDRKNYTYPDLPKAYQISQADFPLCLGGSVTLSDGKKIGITRIHVEEDAGKLIHENGRTLIDYNRCGVPLIEIVSEPDMCSGEEAAEYAACLQKIMRYIGVSDCKMQEGSMRCDVNLSIRLPGAAPGVRTEIKNLNSFNNIIKAVAAEAKRQAEILDAGGRVVQATLRYDADRDAISIMRIKEQADDYRFFPEPDIMSFIVSDDDMAAEKGKIPELPAERAERYVKSYALSKEASELLTRHRRAAEYFEGAVSYGATPKNAANLMQRVMFTVLDNESARESFDVKTTARDAAELIKLLDEKKISFGRATEVFTHMLETGLPASHFIKEEETAGLTDAELEEICRRAVTECAQASDDVRNGRDKAINVLYGFVMKNSRGRADIKKADVILRNILNN